MKLKKICLLLVICLFSLSFAACNKDDSTYGVAVFMLEGGTCDNNNKSISYRYKLNEGETTYLLDPNDNNVFSTAEITRHEYTLDGWYRTKSGEGDDAVYSDKWDFAKDKMGIEGVTLYAKWDKNVKHTFTLVTTFQGKEEVIYTYAVNEGGTVTERFLSTQASRYNFTDESGNKIDATVLNFTDKDGNPWNFSYKHPGGETDTDVKIYVNYIAGKFDFVSTYEELILALSTGIYLLNDIDCGGNTLSFGDYKNLVIEGNGYKIYNFKLDTTLPTRGQESLDGDGSMKNAYISLFNDISGSKISNVRFEDVKVSLNYSSFDKIDEIYFSPFANVADSNTEISNVSISSSIYLNSAIHCTIMDRPIYKTVNEYPTLTFTNVNVDTDFE